ncbi:MAG TPA: hypothetical protein VMG10_29320 [Gemmataceae bacterium]|nr:hypothetical protein [Gemmataceae bacterium]
MFGRKGVTWVLAVSALWMSPCGRMRETTKSSAPEKNLPTAKSVQPTKTAEPPVGPQQVTFHVPGMIDRQGIT